MPYDTKFYTAKEWRDMWLKADTYKGFTEIVRAIQVNTLTHAIAVVEYAPILTSHLELCALLDLERKQVEQGYVNKPLTDGE